MTALDAILGAILIYNGFTGLRRGLVRSIFDFFAIFLSAYLAFHYHVEITGWLHTWLPTSDSDSAVIGISVSWILCFLILSGIGMALDKFVKTFYLGTLNWMGGLFFGLLKGAVFAVPILIPLTLANPTMVDDSVLAKPLKTTIESLIHSYFNDKHFFMPSPSVD
ncbi:MAG: CvpA family protein [Candidatus Margulisiibacteriota bacterium]